METGDTAGALHRIVATVVVHTSDTPESVKHRPLTFTGLAAAVLIVCGPLPGSVAGCDFARSEFESDVRGSLLKEMSEQSYRPINYKGTPDVVKTKQSEAKKFFCEKWPSNESVSRI